MRGVTEAERRAAWKRIESAAKHYKVELKGSQVETFSRPQKKSLHEGGTASRGMAQ